MQVRLISKTMPLIQSDSVASSPEGLIAFTARVSSQNQENPDYEGLLKYCIEHGHWSPFEMADLTVEIETSRAIAQQILRHRSFSFQEFSQRYAQATSFETYEARRQDTKNRQNSINDMSDDTKDWFSRAQSEVIGIAEDFYNEALSKGIAKEQARFLLPLSTTTKLYMKGSVRSWIHYLQLRTDASTQKEHRDIALAIKTLFNNEFPTIAKALEWA